MLQLPREALRPGVCDQGCLAAPSPGSSHLHVTSNFRALVDYLFRSWLQSGFACSFWSPCPALLGPSVVLAPCPDDGRGRALSPLVRGAPGIAGLLLVSPHSWVLW